MDIRPPKPVYKSIKQKINDAMLDMPNEPMGYSKVNNLKETIEIRFNETFYDQYTEETKKKEDN